MHPRTASFHAASGSYFELALCDEGPCRRRPDELSAVQAFRIERQPDPVMPEDLCQIATPASEDIEIAGVGIPLQALLNLQSQTLHAAPHIGVARCDPDPDAARYWDHRRLRTSRTRPNASASTFSSTLTRLPPPSSISIRPRRLRDGIAAGASVDETLSAAAGVS